jgi:hypothetical protein
VMSLRLSSPSSLALLALVAPSPSSEQDNPWEGFHHGVLNTSGRGPANRHRPQGVDQRDVTMVAEQKRCCFVLSVVMFPSANLTLTCCLLGCLF